MNEIRWTEKRRVCLTYSPGGHYTELLKATEGINFTNCYHVTFRSGRLIEGEDIHFVSHPQRSILRTLVNAAQSLAILLRQQPDLIISTGADVAVPTLILGRLFGAKVVFIETCGTLSPSLAGRLVYPFCNLFVVQWPTKVSFFPRARQANGPLL